MQYNAKDTKLTTPGPWKADRGYIRTLGGDCLGNYPWTLADMTDHNNGRLMAAAPVLLAASQNAINGLWELLGQEGLPAAYKDKLTDMQTDLLAAVRSVYPADNFTGEI